MKGLIVTLSIKVMCHNKSAIMLSAVMLSVAILLIVMQSAVMLTVANLLIVMLNGVMLSVIMLNVVAPYICSARNSPTIRVKYVCC